jgi:hypothetical protein
MRRRLGHVCPISLCLCVCAFTGGCEYVHTPSCWGADGRGRGGRTGATAAAMQRALQMLASPTAPPAPPLETVTAEQLCAALAVPGPAQALACALTVHWAESAVPMDALAGLCVRLVRAPFLLAVLNMHAALVPLVRAVEAVANTAVAAAAAVPWHALTTLLWWTQAILEHYGVCAAGEGGAHTAIGKTTDVRTRWWQVVARPLVVLAIPDGLCAAFVGRGWCAPASVADDARAMVEDGTNTDTRATDDADVVGELLRALVLDPTAPGPPADAALSVLLSLHTYTHLNSINTLTYSRTTTYSHTHTHTHTHTCIYVVVSCASLTGLGGCGCG